MNVVKQRNFQKDHPVCDKEKERLSLYLQQTAQECLFLLVVNDLRWKFAEPLPERASLDC